MVLLKNIIDNNFIVIDNNNFVISCKNKTRFWDGLWILDIEWFLILWTLYQFF